MAKNRETTDMWQNVSRRTRAGVALAGALSLLACSDMLEVPFPGRIPTDQLISPSLAGVLVSSVIGDFECAYSNYVGGSAVHSDEYESSNGNIPLTLWGERGISNTEDDYVLGQCETTSSFGLNLTLYTARLQSETIFKQLDGWTDEEVSTVDPQLRTNYKATVRAYGAYAYTLMGETFCSVAFDRGPESPPTIALDSAEIKFQEAITLAQSTGNTDILLMSRLGLARVKMDLKKWADAAALASTFTDPTYVKVATRGANDTRRYNKLFYYASELGAFVVANAYRDMAVTDPRVKVADAGRGAFLQNVELWVTTKYAGRESPITLASYKEARLIHAEALAQQGQVAAAMDIINADRATAGLGPLNAATQAEAVAAVIAERRAVLSFEGGHRLNDLLRTHTPWKVGSNIYTGRIYGQTTCWPFPVKESQGA
jgi:hypothetical protein